MIAADELLALRLANHHLSAPSLDAPASVVAHLGAVQAQDYPAAKWAVAQRLAGSATDEHVEQAFAEGKILRTHVLRPTWHFVAPADVRWMLALTGPRIKAAMATSTRNLGDSDGLLQRTTAIIGSALKGRSLTRPELGAVLRQTGIELNPAQLQLVVFHAELDALIISGPPRGKQQTYALLEERVPPAPELTRDEALAELTWRYFNSHGPALIADCNWWSGLTMSDIKRGISLNEHRLQCATFAGKTYYFAPGSAAGTALRRSVHLLSNYDEYTVAYRSRELYFDPDLRRTGNPREDVPFGNVIVAGGKVAGRWQRQANEVTWWIDASISLQRDLDRAAKRFDAFLRPAAAFSSTN